MRKHYYAAIFNGQPFYSGGPQHAHRDSETVVTETQADFDELLRRWNRSGRGSWHYEATTKNGLASQSLTKAEVHNLQALHEGPLRYWVFPNYSSAERNPPSAAPFLMQQMAPLVGGIIREVSVLSGDWPALAVELPDGRVLQVEVSRDSEGNGPGYLFIEEL